MLLAAGVSAIEPMPAQALPPNIGERWYPTFQSEFDIPADADHSSKVLIEEYDRLEPHSDDAKWEYREGANKQAYAVEDNAFVTRLNDGTSALVLRTSANPSPGLANSEPIWTGYIRTRNYSNTGPNNNLNFAQRFGYFEARMKFQSSPGQWGAFWLMPERNIYCADNSGRDATEIDIVEGFPNPPGAPRNRHRKVNIAVHYDGYGDAHKRQSRSIPSRNDRRISPGFDASEFHTYGFLWTPDSYVWYLDGIPVHRIDDPNIISQTEKYLKLSTEVAGWSGRLDHKRLPADTVVDWVRVWQTNRLAKGNPHVYDITDERIELGDGVHTKKAPTGHWCLNTIAESQTSEHGRITIPLEGPVDAEQIGIRLSNKGAGVTEVKLLIDGLEHHVWRNVAEDPLFILKSFPRRKVKESLEITWRGKIGINQVYIVPQTSFETTHLERIDTGR